MFANLLSGCKLGVLSDTHGSLAAWKSAVKLFKDPDGVLHAGDVLYHGPRNTIPGGYTPSGLAESINRYSGIIFISRGNCDSDADQMVLTPLLAPYVSLWWNGKKILMMHGDNFPLLKQMAVDFNADLAISGHTHIASVSREGNTIFLNPGSTTMPKGKDPASAAIVDAIGITIHTLDGGFMSSEKW